MGSRREYFLLSHTAVCDLGQVTCCTFSDSEDFTGRPVSQCLYCKYIGSVRHLEGVQWMIEITVIICRGHRSQTWCGRGKGTLYGIGRLRDFTLRRVMLQSQLKFPEESETSCSLTG